MGRDQVGGARSRCSCPIQLLAPEKWILALAAGCPSRLLRRNAVVGLGSHIGGNSRDAASGFSPAKRGEAPFGRSISHHIGLAGRLEYSRALPETHDDLLELSP